MTETLFAFRYLRHRRESGVFQRWRADVRARLSGDSKALMLAPLLPPERVPFDLFTLCGRTGSLDVAVDNLRSRTAEHLSAEVAFSGAMLPLPSWARHIAAADREWIDQLAMAIRKAHQAVVEPYWPQIQARLNAERAEHGRRLLGLGVEHLLAHLHPTVRWHSPVLELSGPSWTPHAAGFAPVGWQADHHLNGRGIVVIFSMFCSVPLQVCDASQGLNDSEVWLFVPATSALGALVPPLPHAAADGHALAALLGRTRAAALRAVAAGPVTTSGLARKVGISLPTASQQAGVLRDAGLIVTHRVGKAVLHTTTATGEALLADDALGGTTGTPNPDGRHHTPVPSSRPARGDKPRLT
ncbi:winged helix-turn-helix domain-containing protein [Spirillospora sp. NBC_00431]